jgi:hypothetical protein
MADSNKQLYWTLFLLPIISIFAFVIMYAAPEISSVKTQQNQRLEDNLLQDKLLSSPDCFAYSDNGIIKTGYIDINKYKIERIHDCLKDFEQKRSFSIDLKIRGQSQGEIISKELIQGRGTITYKRPVIIVNNTQQKNAVFEMKVFYR